MHFQGGEGGTEERGAAGEFKVTGGEEPILW